jgi:hypothetical protein
MGTGGKARPGRDAEHSPPSNAEVSNEYDLYTLSPWRLHGVTGQLHFYFTFISNGHSKYVNMVLTCVLFRQ